jgi:cytochrome c peroxidase
MALSRRPAIAAIAALALAACKRQPPPVPIWEMESPVVALPRAPLGITADFAALGFQVTPDKVRLGRWLFYDRRLSADGTTSCGDCHRPQNAFSEPEPRSTGVGGRRGVRKAPTFVNGAFSVYPVYFWDGRAASLAEQAKAPMANPVEMANTHEGVVATVAGLAGYRTAFRRAFGDDRIDVDRVAEAIAAYEATRLSGNSAYDRYDAGEVTALTAQQEMGRELFFGKAACNGCHLGQNFTDSRFHNLGIGWVEPPRGADPRTGFKDPGRAAVSRDPKDTGAFKTPTLRDCTRHAPHMHDGSMTTMRQVVMHYAKGGNPNPWLDEAVKPLALSAAEVDALVAFLSALEGEGYQDVAPATFPD